MWQNNIQLIEHVDMLIMIWMCIQEAFRIINDELKTHLKISIIWLNKLSKNLYERYFYLGSQKDEEKQSSSRPTSATRPPSAGRPASASKRRGIVKRASTLAGKDAAKLAAVTSGDEPPPVNWSSQCQLEFVLFCEHEQVSFIVKINLQFNLKCY